MQIVKAKRDIILKPIQMVMGIVDRRNTLSILSNILIIKKDFNILFISTDLELQATVCISCDKEIDLNSISTTVSAKKLFDVLKSMPDEKINLSINDHRLIVESRNIKLILQTISAKEFPLIISIDKFIAQFSLSQKKFRELLNYVYFAMGNQDIRYYLNGILLILDGDELIAVATDGHRLAYSATKVNSFTTSKQQVIIPRKTVLELQRVLNDIEEIVQINVAQSQIKFTFSHIELLSKLVEGQYPDFYFILSKLYDNTFTINRELFKCSLQRASILISDKFKGIKFSISRQKLRIMSINSSQEETQEDIAIKYNGNSVDIGLNVTYLLDVILNLKSDIFQISFSDSNSSLLISIPENKKFKYVVMPMRV